MTYQWVSKIQKITANLHSDATGGSRGWPQDIPHPHGPQDATGDGVFTGGWRVTGSRVPVLLIKAHGASVLETPAKTILNMTYIGRQSMGCSEIQTGERDSYRSSARVTIYMSLSSPESKLSSLFAVAREPVISVIVTTP